MRTNSSVFCPITIMTKNLERRRKPCIDYSKEKSIISTGSFCFSFLITISVYVIYRQKYLIGNAATGALSPVTLNNSLTQSLPSFLAIFILFLSNCFFMTKVISVIAGSFFGRMFFCPPFLPFCLVFSSFLFVHPKRITYF